MSCKYCTSEREWGGECKSIPVKTSRPGWKVYLYLCKGENPTLEIDLDNFDEFCSVSLPIECCPMCGRKLIKEEEE